MATELLDLFAKDGFLPWVYENKVLAKELFGLNIKFAVSCFQSTLKFKFAASIHFVKLYNFVDVLIIFNFILGFGW